MNSKGQRRAKRGKREFAAAAERPSMDWRRHTLNVSSGELNVRYINLSSPIASTVYSTRYMEYLIDQQPGLNRVPMAELTTIILATVCDQDTWPALAKLRKAHPHAMIVVGGFEAYCGEWMLAFADVVVVGNAERFIEDLGRTGWINLDLPEVMTRDTIGVRPTIPFEETDITRYPLIQVSPNLFYCVAGYGCKGKCAFCITGWVQGYRPATAGRIHALAKEVAKLGAKVTLVRNDYDSWRYGPRINVQSMRIQDFIDDRAIEFVNKGSWVRFGIEGSPRLRGAN